MSVQAGATALFRMKVMPAAGGCETLTCEFAGIVTDPSVVTAIIFTGMGVLVALTYVRTAIETCRCERRRVLNERDAFEEFANRVESLDPVSAKSSTAIAGGSFTKAHQTIGSGNKTDRTLQQVISIYKETVMSVSHYETEYDETVSESMAAELGTDTATSLATNGTLFPPAQRALVDRTRKAVDARTSLANAIETELDSLSDTDTKLTAIDRRRRRLINHLAGVEGDKTDAAIDIWQGLDDLETDTEALATERQQSLRKAPLRVDYAIFDSKKTGFYGYLYSRMEGPQHPVLAQTAYLAATIREDRDRITNCISNSG